MAALGVVGYGVAVVFLLFGGPDLALTQFAIETLSVLLFVLVLRRLPRLRVLSPRSERIRDGVVAVAGGVFVTALVLAATAAPHPTPLRDYFGATSLALANGRNVVNVILVDFRGFDTLGEITVLAVAALGVVALLRLRGSAAERRPSSGIAHPPLRHALPASRSCCSSRCSCSSAGTTSPAGGFVGGLVAATAFALVLLSEGLEAARRLLRVDPLAFVAAGLAVALASGLPPLVRGWPYMTGLWLKVPLPVVGKIGSPGRVRRGGLPRGPRDRAGDPLRARRGGAVTVLFAVVIGILYAAGLYLVMRRNVVKLVLGLALLGHAANLLIFTVGRLSRDGAPIVPPGAERLVPPHADPVPQALVLTAIVIGFGVQAFALVLVKLAHRETGTDDLDALRSTDS